MNTPSESWADIQSDKLRENTGGGTWACGIFKIAANPT